MLRLCVQGTRFGEASQDGSGGRAIGFYGNAISLSSDGTIVAIGAIYNDGNGSNSGHVRVFSGNNFYVLDQE